MTVTQLLRASILAVLTVTATVGSLTTNTADAWAPGQDLGARLLPYDARRL
jgi:hypothetical protein